MPLFKIVDNFVEVILENGETFHPKDWYDYVKNHYYTNLPTQFMWIMIALPGQQLQSLSGNPFHVMAVGGGRATVEIGPCTVSAEPVASVENEAGWLFIVKADELPGGGIPVQESQ